MALAFVAVASFESPTDSVPAYVVSASRPAMVIRPVIVSTLARVLESLPVAARLRVDSRTASHRRRLRRTR